MRSLRFSSDSDTIHKQRLGFSRKSFEYSFNVYCYMSKCLRVTINEFVFTSRSSNECELESESLFLPPLLVSISMHAYFCKKATELISTRVKRKVKNKTKLLRMGICFREKRKREMERGRERQRGHLWHLSHRRLCHHSHYRHASSLLLSSPSSSSSSSSHASG